MKPPQSSPYRIKKNKQSKSGLYYNQNGMQSQQYQSEFQVISIAQLLKKLFWGIQRIYVALKYQIYRLTTGAIGNFRISWFKVGLIAFAVFILMKKDIQFSFNINAPLQQTTTDIEAATARTTANEFGMVQPVHMQKRTQRNLKTIDPDELDVQEVKNYIKRFSKVAIAEMEKFGIPASVKMAQGILESWSGNHPVTQSDNNHFGILLANNTYNSAWENWRSHSMLLKNEHPYLFEHKMSYKGWAKALRKNVYNHDKSYDKKLIRLIERHQLYLLDEAVF